MIDGGADEDRNGSSSSERQHYYLGGASYMGGCWGLGYNIVYIIFVSKIILSDASVRPCLSKSGRLFGGSSTCKLSGCCCCCWRISRGELEEKRIFIIQQTFLEKKNSPCVCYGLPPPAPPPAQRSERSLFCCVEARIGSNFTQDNIEENQLL